GSGKSTTLATLIDIINSERAAHIITLEDPIEFLNRHKRSVVNQREIGLDSRSFADALRSALREDPDVILVGEMRDLETVAIAISAAETGHLVFATLHTNDTVQSVDRVIDMFPPHQQQQIRVQFASILVGIVAQQLIPRLNGGGRVVAAEVLVANPAVRNLIREGKTHQIYSILQTGSKQGMQSLDACLRDLYNRRLISLSEALMRANDPEEFKRLANVV
ncbi:MAG: type IV pilus twitching motility protein PilT, partial [Bacillota bacterium]